MLQKYKGLIASPGIATGPAKIYSKADLVIKKKKLENGIEEEIEKLKSAFETYRIRLENTKADNEAQASVTQAHVELLCDPYFIESASTLVREEVANASWALQKTVDQMAAMMESLDDPYLRERGADYRDIGQNLLYILEGVDGGDLSQLKEDCIIISSELTPSDTSTMDREHVLGFANDLGGKTSHVAIIAQTLDIPALVGMKTITQEVKDGDDLILDADRGLLLINPDDQTKECYKIRIRKREEEKARLEEVKDRAAVTGDGKEIEVVCNVGNLEDLEDGLNRGADGVGLFRTEFLYMGNDHFPSEEEQFQVYKAAASRLGQSPLLIRTLDIGGDKSLSYFDFPKENNPFLGWRALRISFDLPDVFQDQVRAILRASAFGNVKLFLPMVVSVEEILEAQDRIASIKKDLRQEGIPFNEAMEVGIMIETPASVLIAEELANYCDFFSIGTNDLTQYILAADRGNEKVANIYNSYHPAVLRAIKKVIDAAHRSGKWCGMCGGFASDPQATYMLIGMGLDEFSVVGSKVAKIKDLILRSKLDSAQDFANKILATDRLNEVEKLIEENPFR